MLRFRPPTRAQKRFTRPPVPSQGHYTLATLPPGTYDVSINAPGFYPNNQQNVSVGATEPLRLDVHLLEYQLGTLGDGREFRVQLTSPHPAPSGPTPRTADGKPDLSGVWFAQRTVDPGKPEPLPWAEALLARTSRQQREGRSRRALPAARHHQRGGFVSLQTGSNAHPAGDAVRGRHPEPSPGLLRWTRPSQGSESYVDGTFHRTLGRRHAGDRHRRLRRPILARYRGSSAHRNDARHRALSAARSGTSRNRIHHRRSGSLCEALENHPRASELDAGDDIGEYVCTENEKDVEHMVGK